MLFLRKPFILHLETIEDQGVENGLWLCSLCFLGPCDQLLSIEEVVPNLRFPNWHSSQSYHQSHPTDFSTLWNLSCESFQHFVPSTMPSSPRQSWVISIWFVASIVSVSWHHTVKVFYLMSAIAFSYESFSTLCLFCSSLPVWSASCAGYWVVPLSPVLICIAPSAGSPIQSFVHFLYMSIPLLCFGPLWFDRAKQFWHRMKRSRKGIWLPKYKLRLFHNSIWNSKKR